MDFKHNFKTVIFLFPEYFENGACFQDHNPRALPDGQHLPAHKMKPSLCKEACFIDNSYAFCGLQNGNECFCGNEEPSPDDLLPDSDCNIPCKGNTKRMCGAGWKNNIFKKSGIMPFWQDIVSLRVFF